ncbi:MAG: 50S ribosomal protein L3 N(5)-glutamine methyltransferase, partial [Gammaproteobacteria bacterium]
RVLAGDLYAPLPEGARFDLILANPPYVDAGDLASLPAEFRHEPVLGLDGGDDGLDLVRRILERALHWLASDGLLVCEVGMSAAALLRAFPRLPCVWPELERGGGGVFLLTAEALRPVAGMSSSTSTLDE